MNMKKAFFFIKLMRMSKSILAQILVAIVLFLAIETHAQCGPYQYFTGSSQAKMTNDGWVTSGGTWSYIQNSAISRSGSQHIAQSNRNTTIPAYIKSPKINAPKTFSFWAKFSPTQTTAVNPAAKALLILLLISSSVSPKS